MKQKMTLIGAGVGAALFLAIGLLPALLYGGYAGVMLAAGILGTPIPATVAAKLLIVFGMILGCLGIGSLFTVGGAAIGSLIATVLDHPTDLVEATE